MNLKKSASPTVFRSIASIYRCFSTVAHRHSVGIIVIGDEILKGFTQDTNSTFLCNNLFKAGCKVERIAVIPDNLNIIASEVYDFSNKYHHVITAGGIGPTHDDITYEGVALAFKENLEYNFEIVALLKAYFGQDLDQSSPHFKLANIPKSSVLLWGEDKISGRKALFPIVKVRNVCIFPGIPKLLYRSFKMLNDEFGNKSCQNFWRVFYLNISEFDIADDLAALAKRYQEKVNFGSYPIMDHSYITLKITLDSLDKFAVDAAGVDFKNMLIADNKGEAIVPYDPDPLENCVQKLDNSLSSWKLSSPDFYSEVIKSMEVIDQCLNEYGFDEICLSFNGGKDCTALLHLLWCSLLKKYGFSANLKTLYIQQRHPFKEIESFINSCKINYRLNVITVTADYREALMQLKESNPEIKVIFMGTRNSDPRSFQQNHFAPTDAGWPSYIRVCPLIGWRYSHIWQFLRSIYLPYCVLYDRGYTSLGDQTTQPNPALQFVDKFGVKRYKSAHFLEDERLERVGRDNST